MINNLIFLFGVKLGYEIYDICIDVIVVMVVVLRFFFKFNCFREIVELKCDYFSYMLRVKVVIGVGYLEIIMVVFRMLNL